MELEVEVEEEKDEVSLLLKMHDALHVIGFNFALPAKHFHFFCVAICMDQYSSAHISAC